MKKVCLIVPNVFPVPATKGGAVETLVTSLIEENEKNHKIDLTCISIWEEKAEQISKQYQNVEMIYLNNMRQGNEKVDLNFLQKDNSLQEYIKQIEKVLDGREFDYIVVEGGDAIAYQELLKKYPKEKCVLHIHGTHFGDISKLKQIYGVYYAVSDYIAKEITKTGMIKPEQVKTVYNGINVSKFHRKITQQEKQELRKQYGIQTEDIVIMFCGRITPEKGIKELMQAFEQMKNRETAKLLLVGSKNFGVKEKSDFEQELKQIAQQLGDKVIFTGFVHNDNLYKMHQISDIAVIPSVWEEAFGLVVVEAMASGLPVITTQSGGIPEIVKDKSAIVLERDDQLVTNLSGKLDLLVQDKQLREELGKRGEMRAEYFSNKVFFERFVEVVEEV